MTSAFFWQNSISLCPASFCTPRPNLPVTPGVSWLPTFAFQSPIMRRTSFLGVSSLSGASLLPQMVKNPPVMQDTWVWSLGWEDPLEKGLATHSVFLPGEFHGQRSLEGYSLWGHKQLDTIEWLTLWLSLYPRASGRGLSMDQQCGFHTPCEGLYKPIAFARSQWCVLWLDPVSVVGEAKILFENFPSTLGGPKDEAMPPDEMPLVWAI